MRTICTNDDLNLLQEHQALTHDLLEALRENLVQNIAYLLELEPDEEESLEDHGPIFVLERGDNLKSIPAANLQARRGGLIKVIPEYVEEITLPCEEYWKALIIYNDSYAPTFWIPKGLESMADEQFA